MSVTINGSTGVTTPGISNSEGYTGDGLTIAAGAPSGAVQVDTSGNLGLGVTPSAWGSSFKAYQVGRASLYTYTGGNASVVASNSYNDGTNSRYISSDYAGSYVISSGNHAWYTAPSGTAGNAITFTQAMTLTAAGQHQTLTTNGTLMNAYDCRAWVNFNGTGTVAIRASGNVSSITDNGTGDYTVNFTTAMPDANYNAVISQGNDNSANAGVRGANILATQVAPTTSAVRVGTWASTGTRSSEDSSYVFLSIFR